MTALNFLPDPDAEDVPAVAFLIIIPRPSHQTAAAAASRRSLAEGNVLDDEDWR